MVDRPDSGDSGQLREGSFFVQPSENLLDRITESLEQKPEYRNRLELMKELQEPVPQAGRIEGFKGDWALVARLTLPIDMAARVVEPGFFKDKRVFYDWADKHPHYLSYDRRAAMARRPFHGFGGESDPVTPTTPSIFLRSDS